MRGIFTNTKKKSGKPWAAIISVVCFALIILVVVMGVKNVSSAAGTEQAKITEQAVRRAAVECYAVEGYYPPSLEYLEEHYGLMLDTGRYVYHYRSIASNLMPEIKVFPNQEGV